MGRLLNFFLLNWVLNGSLVKYFSLTFCKLMLFLTLFINNLLLSLHLFHLPAFSAPLVSLSGKKACLPCVTFLADYCHYQLRLVSYVESTMVALCLFLNRIVDLDTVVADIEFSFQLIETNMASSALLLLYTASWNHSCWMNNFFASFISISVVVWIYSLEIWLVNLLKLSLILVDFVQDLINL